MRKIILTCSVECHRVIGGPFRVLYTRPLFFWVRMEANWMSSALKYSGYLAVFIHKSLIRRVCVCERLTLMNETFFFLFLRESLSSLSLENERHVGGRQCLTLLFITAKRSKSFMRRDEKKARNAHSWHTSARRLPMEEFQFRNSYRFCCDSTLLLFSFLFSEWKRNCEMKTNKSLKTLSIASLIDAPISSHNSRRRAISFENETLF